MKVKLKYRIMLIISAIVHFLEVKWNVKPFNSLLSFLSRRSFVDVLMNNIVSLSLEMDRFSDEWFIDGKIKPNYEGAYKTFKKEILDPWNVIVEKFIILWDGFNSEMLYFLYNNFQEGMATFLVSDSFLKEDLDSLADEIHEAYHTMSDTKEIPWTLGDVYIINAEIMNWGSYIKDLSKIA